MTDAPDLFDHAQITAVRANPSDPARVRVLVNRKRFAEILLDDADRLALRAGTPWTPELAERVEHAGAVCAAWRAAIRLIRARARSRAETVRRLRQKGHDVEVASLVADRLVAQGLIDDAAFADQAARSIISRRPAGPRFIESKLREKGVSGDLAREASRAALEDQDTRASAIELAERAARSLPPGLDPAAARRRLLGRLARRGFDTDDAFAAVEHVLARDRR